MFKCDACQNDYYKTMSIEAWGRRQTLDSFECAIQPLAPVCDHCGCWIITTPPSGEAHSPSVGALDKASGSRELCVGRDGPSTNSIGSGQRRRVPGR